MSRPAKKARTSGTSADQMLREIQEDLARQQAVLDSYTTTLEDLVAAADAQGDLSGASQQPTFNVEQELDAYFDADAYLAEVMASGNMAPTQFQLAPPPPIMSPLKAMKARTGFLNRSQSRRSPLQVRAKRQMPYKPTKLSKRIKGGMRKRKLTSRRRASC